MPNAWDSGLRVKIVETVDFSKIQKAAQKAACDILVGFPSGRQHVPTIHKNKQGKYEGYNGESVEEIEPIETAELAKALSYGTATIPARPFLEDGIEDKKKELAEALAQEAKKVMDGGQANWNKVGTMAVGAVQEFVRSDYYKSTKPNSKKTQEYKGSDKPLIDGADLINSLAFIINAESINTAQGTMNTEQYAGADFRSGT
jgi:hypothetical protein